MVVGHGHLPGMGGDDGAAQAQTQTQAAAAVGDGIAAGVEHLEHLALFGIADAGAVVRHAEHRVLPLTAGGNGDGGSGGRVFDGVVHQIDEHLHNQPGIAFCQQQLVLMGNGDGVFGFFSVDVLHGLGHQLLRQLRLGAQLHPALLNPGDGQQIFHQIIKPLGIVVDVAVHLVPGVRGQALRAGKQDTGIAGDGGEGGAQVVGYGAQQIGPELFVLGQQLGLLLLPGVAAVFQHQRALAQNGQKDAVFKGLHRLGSGDADAAVEPVVDPDGVAEGGIIRRGILPGVHGDLPVQQLVQLGAGHLKNGLLGLGLLQHLVGFQQQIGAVGGPGGLGDLTFQLVRQGAHHQGGHNQNQEGHGRAVLVDTQGQPGGGEAVVEHQHAAQRRQDIAAAGGGGHGGQQHRQQVDGHDIGLRKAHLGEHIAQNRSQRQQGGGDSQIPENELGLYRVGAVGRGGAGVGDDVDIHARGDGDELFCQGGLAPGVLAPGGAAADDDFGDPGQPGVLRNLVGDIVAEHRFHGGPQLLGQLGVLPQPGLILLRHGSIAGGADEQGGEAAAEGPGHGGGGADDAGIGGRRGQTGKNMFCGLFHEMHPPERIDN